MPHDYYFQNLLETIQREIKNSNKKPFVIAIDGRGGSGKSTLATKLENLLPNSKRFILDAFDLNGADFFSPEKIAKNFEIDFENRPFDIPKLQRELTQENLEIVILEGTFGFKNLENINLDLKIWVEVNKEIATQRLNKRETNERTEIDPKIIRLSTEKWQEAEDRYLQNFEPDKKADIIISATNGIYELVVDRTEWRPEVFEYQELIKAWWKEIFVDVKLETIEVANHGMNCSYILNSELVLKILKPKYVWDNPVEEKDKSKIIENYKQIQKAKPDFTPKVLLSDYSTIFKAYVILSEYLPNQDLYQLYYKANTKQKIEYLNQFITLVKDFHKNFPGKIHGDLHFSNVLVSGSKLYLIDFDNMCEANIFHDFYGIMQGLLLPICCVTEDLEVHYPKPLIAELEEVIRQYPELLPQGKVEEAKLVFRDCFDDKLKNPKFKVQLDPLYKKVFEEYWFETLAKIQTN